MCLYWLPSLTGNRWYGCLCVCVLYWAWRDNWLCKTGDGNEKEKNMNVHFILTHPPISLCNFPRLITYGGQIIMLPGLQSDNNFLFLWYMAYPSQKSQMHYLACFKPFEWGHWKARDTGQCTNNGALWPFYKSHWMYWRNGSYWKLCIFWCQCIFGFLVKGRILDNRIFTNLCWWSY